MKMIIDISEDLYEAYKNRPPMLGDAGMDNITQAIANGMPLPKDRGRLLVLTEEKVKENLMKLSFSCQKWISEVGLSFATFAIIEADKEDNNDSSSI